MAGEQLFMVGDATPMTNVPLVIANASERKFRLDAAVFPEGIATPFSGYSIEIFNSNGDNIQSPGNTTIDSIDEVTGEMVITVALHSAAHSAALNGRLRPKTEVGEIATYDISMDRERSERQTMSYQAANELYKQRELLAKAHSIELTGYLNGSTDLSDEVEEGDYTFQLEYKGGHIRVVGKANSHHLAEGIGGVQTLTLSFQGVGKLLKSNV